MHLKYLTYDTHDPTAIASFWGAVLDAPVGESPTGAYVIPPSGPRLLFLTVPESKTAKNRCHPDYHTRDLDGDVARVLGLGAIETDRFAQPSRFVVFEDPDGNEFCLVEDDHPDPADQPG